MRFSSSLGPAQRTSCLRYRRLLPLQYDSEFGHYEVALTVSLTNPTAFLFAQFTLDERNFNVRAVAVLGNADIEAGALTSVAASSSCHATHYKLEGANRDVLTSQSAPSAIYIALQFSLPLQGQLDAFCWLPCERGY
jgi:hypothetical protein